MRQWHAHQGALLDEAIRLLILIVALYQRLRTKSKVVNESGKGNGKAGRSNGKSGRQLRLFSWALSLEEAAASMNAAKQNAKVG